MDKSDLIKALANTFDMTINDARVCVDTLFDSMADALVGGRRIEIRGFGAFKVKEYKPYKGRNPRTGEPIQVRGKRLPKFKMSSLLRERMNK